ncbi:MAG: lpxK [Ramlibacter sp.]|jgi:tetraacyldisaccharide 4'-kinase|uniref:tetraacyldisaccharide 4'-kinase n=1 Tax=Ramlibacter sp. TaxID=1917967 RepID=UPI002629EAF7|nr:tetraacyldisaccharide 4'-kinase [Ramlibacter sp.]MDB5752485.1 lpxK [Ramlibacter sp.]
MAEALQRAWLSRGLAARLLWPLSLPYRWLGAAHRAAYRRGWLRSERLPVPVVVVGNVIAGGAGKTPAVLAMLDHLRQRGIAAGVVSRGYGRNGGACTEVQPDDDPARVGDEPLLLRRKADVPVFVAARRTDAGRALLAAYPAIQVIVSDDGLQHHAMARDIDICVFDRRGTGNGWLLPAGPLREPWPRPVDLVLRHPEADALAGHRMTRTLAPTAVRADGRRIPLADLFDQPLEVVAGVANPGAFFGMLREAGLQLARTHPLPDHHPFTDAGEFADTRLTLVCTEKDAVKLWRLRPDAWAVPLELRIDEAFWRSFDRLLDAKLSSVHGLQAH